jgi:hypothetical protein
MKKHQLYFPPNPATQTVVDTGPGRALHITLSHKEDTTQAVSFYDRAGNQLAHYELHPLGSPYSLTFANRDAFSFEDGLRVNTGKCAVNVVIVY